MIPGYYLCVPFKVWDTCHILRPSTSGLCLKKDRLGDLKMDRTSSQELRPQSEMPVDSECDGDWWRRVMS